MIAPVMTMGLAIKDLLRLGPLAVAVGIVGIEVIEVTEVVMVTDMGRRAAVMVLLAHKPLGNIKHHLLLQGVSPAMATAAIRPFHHTKTWVRLLDSVGPLPHQVWEECINAMLVEALRHRHRRRVMDHLPLLRATNRLHPHQCDR